MSPASNPLAALSEATAAVTAAVASRVVAVRDGQGRRLSGILWSEGRIVTAEECLAGDDPVTLTLPDGRRLEAAIVGRDPSSDVALLTGDTGPVQPLDPAPLPAVGSLSLVVGRSEDGPHAALALVSTAGPEWTSIAGGRIDALLRLGLFLPRALEGGAAVDADGRLIGLAVGDPRRRALVIPAATVMRAVDILTTRGHVGRGYIGLALRPLETAPGLMVVELVEGGPGAAAGFLLGDIVTTWDGEPVRSMRGISRRLGPDAVGREVAVGIIRAGQPSEVHVTIGERQRGER